MSSRKLNLLMFLVDVDGRDAMITLHISREVSVGTIAEV